MSRLDPSVIALDKGLNLQTAKILAPAGSALSSLNYEQVDFQGQKRIDGYARYDGHLLAAIDDYYYIDMEYLQDVETGYAIVNNEMLGRIVGQYSSEQIVAVYNYKLLEQVPYTTGSERDSPEDHQANLIEYNNALRYPVGDLPGHVAGLHWFNDKLYSVAGISFIEVRINGEGETSTLEVGNFIRDVWEAYEEQQVVYVQQKDSTMLVGVAGTDISKWESYGIRSFYSVQDGQGFDIVSYSPELGEASSVASFFEAVTDDQALQETEDPYDIKSGWRFKHLGWEVNFKEGNVPYGGLTSLNQNRQGVGIQGPTSISGNNGRPLSLSQKVNVRGEVPQVNGWKTSTSPDSYNLDPLALSDIDGTYIYADFYVEWDSESGQIITPDITNLELQERAPNSSVPVEDI